MLPEDEVRHLRGEVRPVLDDEGTTIELFGYSQDVSDAKRAEQALLRNESLRALGQLTGGVAHDFNNLLTVVILNLEEAQDVLPEEHDLQEVLAPALHAAVRGAELTSQLLSYARRATLRPERVRPDEFFGALRPLLNRVLGERFELQVLLRHNGGSAMVDPAQLDSAIMNLVINARDAMPQGRFDRARDPVRDAEGRHAGLPGRGHARPLRGDQRQRPRPGHPAAPAEPRVRAVLHDQGGRQGQRDGPQHGLRVRPPVRWPRHDRKPSSRQPRRRLDGGLERGRHDRTAVPPVAAGASDEVEAEVATTPEWNAQGLPRPDRGGPGKRAPHRDPHDAAHGLPGDGCGLVRGGAGCTWSAEAPFDMLFTDIVLPGRMDGVALAEEVRDRSPSTRILLTSGLHRAQPLGGGRAGPRGRVPDEAV